MFIEALAGHGRRTLVMSKGGPFLINKLPNCTGYRNDLISAFRRSFSGSRSLVSGQRSSYALSEYTIKSQSTPLAWAARPNVGPRNTSRIISSRFMATFRDLGFGPGGRNRGSYRSGNPFMGFFHRYKAALLFTLGTIAVAHFVLPPVMNTALPGLKRHPEYVVYGLMGLNLAGYLLWKSPAGTRFMSRYGLLYKDSLHFNSWGMLGSAFSHQELWHIGVNMFVLYNFGMPLARWIGSDQFLAAYLDGAVLSSLGSLMLPVLIRRYSPVPSLGASGAVFTVFGIFTYLVPHAKLALFFIPLPIGAWPVFLCTAAYNAAGMFMKFGISDYAGHLAGSMVGIAWGYYLSEKSKKQRRRRLSQWGF